MDCDRCICLKCLYRSVRKGRKQRDTDTPTKDVSFSGRTNESKHKETFNNFKFYPSETTFIAN
ncbi:MAG: hypothetical protein Harvfovirus14_4 [Harvfovirus sp.]|uniref:Uncharacterized protein n=1 Tax=Harvfovirus sp. TaxID=2487768 RepID=A0A3G5A5C5_9VIRU|nr:MAG: hypothetical protein Harvfovirus14_4 [Harvfovirus sp.]